MALNYHVHVQDHVDEIQLKGLMEELASSKSTSKQVFEHTLVERLSTESETAPSHGPGLRCFAEHVLSASLINVESRVFMMAGLTLDPAPQLKLCHTAGQATEQKPCSGLGERAGTIVVEPESPVEQVDSSPTVSV